MVLIPLNAAADGPRNCRLLKLDPDMIYLLSSHLSLGNLPDLDGTIQWSIPLVAATSGISQRHDAAALRAGS